ncbi:lipopolysaccharide heptosyltransferase II [Stratiformator vulcanicus]|uniref:lipopolysaccharide heptosyltransferase II n=1 Tax=Stratiformator vulcanicus TaxID=2527980 RepID=A0A517QWX5_9PLAN|nr:lipopolysaccharide heptosyltransferase II [Stratiformator vulcanicus]QDT36165.1 ADP-heptose--LPS heptosyltransferase 2 [Stratiformator vulcanicus]
MKIAVFLPNWIGDAVMATPALRAIRDGYPDAEIIAILRPYVLDAVDGTNLFDRVIRWNPKGPYDDERATGVVRKLRAARCELGVLFPNSIRSAVIAWRGRIKRRVGFARDGRGFLLTDRLQPKSRTTPNPVIDEYCRLADAVGCGTDSRQTEAAVAPLHQLELEEFWSAFHPAIRERGIVTLNPGGAFGAAKHWPAESFAALARRISSDLDKTVLVVCGPAEKKEAEQIVELADRPDILSLADQPLTLGLTKAAIRDSDALVTTDSGPRHFAKPFGVPTVTLFGPTHKAWSETYDERSIHVQLDLDCGPCQQRVCPLVHHRCMKDLGPERVFQAVRKLLANTQETRRAA